MHHEHRIPLTRGPHAAGARRTLGWLALGLAGAAAATGLLIAPPDRVQGEAQRLMYLHVPAAWTAFLAFALVLVASGGYLIWRDLRWDRCARVAAEIGTVLTGLAITVGGIWGQAVWGTWWTWDPRLVSTALLLLVYVAYLLARWAHSDGDGSHDGAHQVATSAAPLGITGFVLVPVVHFSVLWWRSLHQPATVLAPGRPPMNALMGVALLLSMAAFTVGAFWIFLHRVAALEAAALQQVTAHVTPPPAAPARRRTR